MECSLCDKKDNLTLCDYCQDYLCEECIKWMELEYVICTHCKGNIDTRCMYKDYNDEYKNDLCMNCVNYYCSSYGCKNMSERCFYCNNGCCENHRDSMIINQCEVCGIKYCIETKYGYRCKKATEHTAGIGCWNCGLYR